ncbi:PD-(D/E)XK nuclease family protein [Desulfobacterota bacterium AH_259_B03_O07]|nr:PD-(D/E)XK nuclease family protein [Desulfobacterota bacterium AH_259_B03_O07]
MEKKPKWNTNLFEHYYNREITKEDRLRIKERVLDSLANFYHSDIFARIRDIEPVSWKPIEQFQSFKIDDYTIGLKIDFAIDIDGNLEIHDWKTGKEDESNIEQLICYALYGEQKWGYNLDNITLKLFYLNDNRIEEYKVSPEQKSEVIDNIIKNCQTMQSLLADPDNNIANKDNFPMIENLNVCKWCFFQEICYGGSVE